MQDPVGDDVLVLLQAQHDRLRWLMTAVVGRSGEERQRAFDEMRELLARHEAAEESVLRPLTRSLPGGALVAGERTDEERWLLDFVTYLEQFPVDSTAFEEQFTLLQEKVSHHAEKEEQKEFPLLRRDLDGATLARARAVVQHEEASASPATGEGAATSSFAALLRHARELLGLPA